MRNGKTSDAVFAEARRKVYKHLLAPEQTSQGIAQRLATIATYDLAADHYETVLAQVGQVTPAQVTGLAKKELSAATRWWYCSGMSRASSARLRRPASTNPNSFADLIRD